MNALQTQNFSDYIVACFTVPKMAVSDFLTEENTYPNLTDGLYILKNGKSYNQTPLMKQLINRPNTLDDYTPRNQKLRTYPYMYVGFSPKGRFTIYI